MKKIITYFLVLIGLFCLLFPVYAADKNTALNPILSLLLGSKQLPALRIVTQDSKVPYLGLFPDGSYYTGHILDDGEVGVSFTTVDGDTLYFAMNSDGRLLRAKIGDALLFFSYMDEFVDVCVTDKNGSSFTFKSFLTEGGTTLPFSIKSVNKASSKAETKFQQINNSFQILGNVAGKVNVEKGLDLAKIINEHREKEAENIPVYDGDIDESIIDAILGQPGFLLDIAACTQGKLISCASAIVTAGEQLVGAAEEIYQFFKDVGAATELAKHVLERMQDKDGDGRAPIQGDCNDTDSTIYRGATEVCDDGIDQSCSGGDSLTDQCGVCGGSNDCVDCFGTVNGEGYVDPCGICRTGTWDAATVCECGDGNLAHPDNASGEECDDGNNIDGDGCSADCKDENGVEDESCNAEWRKMFSDSECSGQINVSVECFPSGNIFSVSGVSDITTTMINGCISTCTGWGQTLLDDYTSESLGATCLAPSEVNGVGCDCPENGGGGMISRYRIMQKP